MVDILDVAYFFILDAAELEDNELDAYKLHMLCVYSQAILLGYMGQPLFKDDIRMYDFGPSVPALIEHYPLGQDLPKIDTESVILLKNDKKFTKLELRVVTLVTVTYSYLANWSIRERVKSDFKDFLSSRVTISKNVLKSKFHKHLLPLHDNTINLWELDVY